MGELAGKWEPIFCIDGGITTGLCWGCFPKDGSLRSRVARARAGGALEFREVMPVWGAGIAEIEPELSVALQIVDLLDVWNEKLRGVGLYPSTVILEDYQLNIAKTRSTDRWRLAPVRINSAVSLTLVNWGLEESGVWLHTPVLCSPSMSKTFATNERLKKWGLWVVGKQHARDAARVAAWYLASNRSRTRPEEVV